jgi:hypothetical protein
MENRKACPKLTVLSTAQTSGIAPDRGVPHIGTGHILSWTRYDKQAKSV